ncbi:hypothetical protein CAEBREN_15173 [Caenorhabditis brenneri]|uniref:Uncharacterized protein n=1 Tax=Caenorhabditis brenneri TaxID=135651 RepID=G0PA78_CAEBE|nr:hypothetical protein CAEBREN_15173 [Caenorhabditis brenneri]
MPGGIPKDLGSSDLEIPLEDRKIAEKNQDTASSEPDPMLLREFFCPLLPKLNLTPIRYSDNTKVMDLTQDTISSESEAVLLQHKIWDILCPKMFFECPIGIKELGQSMLIYAGGLKKNENIEKMADPEIGVCNPNVLRHWVLDAHRFWSFVLKNTQQRINWIQEMIPALGLPDDQEGEQEDYGSPWTSIDRDQRKGIQKQHSKAMRKGVELLNKLNQEDVDLSKIKSDIERLASRMLIVKNLFKMILVQSLPLFQKILEDEATNPANVMQYCPPDDAELPECCRKTLKLFARRLVHGPSRWERLQRYVCRKLGITYIPNVQCRFLRQIIAAQEH